MKANVFDTWVETKDGNTIHFDVITETKDHMKALEYANKYLASIGIKDAKIESKSCDFCHTESGIKKETEDEITKNGFYILKMSGCP